MPADTSKHHPSNISRRPYRKVSTEEEIELKRARGEISCAECRRLKLKCDKKIPCGSCVRRGCATICPNGSLSTGQGTRFVLADTEHLHRKIAEMGQRIRQLEDALSIFQAGTSSEVHPLLSDDLLAIKHGLEIPQMASGEATNDQHAPPIDALGTLTITDGGESNYYGRSAGSETLFLAGAELGSAELGSSSTQIDELPQVSSEVARLASVLPFGKGGFTDTEKTREVLDSLYNLLPPYPRATTLCETYMENAAWIFRPISREELIDEILAPVYVLAQNRNKNSEPRAEVSPHTLAVLYMVFSHGALTDLTLPPYNSEAENYFHLGRVALSLRSVFDLPTTQTVQALCLMAYYHSNGGRRYTIDSAWSIIALSNKLAQSMGLHRDPARFNLPPKTIQRRRTLFWEIFSADLFHSMALGRPPSVSLSYVDCEFPEDDTARINDNGEVEVGFFRWKHSFTRDVFIPVTELTLTAAPPSYSTILELDRKLREKVLPPSLNLYRSSSTDEYTTPTAYVRGRLLFQFRTSTMLYLHRSFFAQAMMEFPSNPLRSPFAPSFLAAYRCASAIIKTTVLNFQKYPELFARFWTMWSHLLSAAVIVGTIATRAPSSTMAPAALVELDLALDLFRNGAMQSPRARSGLPILVKLKEKAQQAQMKFHSGASLYKSPPALLPEVGGDDELAIFAGQTRILVSKILSKESRRKVRPTSTSMAEPSKSPGNTPASTSDESHSPPDSVPEVHPSLVEYLSMLPSPPSISNSSAINPSSVAHPQEFTQSSPFPSNVSTENSSLASSVATSQPFTPPDIPSLYDQSFAESWSNMEIFDSNVINMQSMGGLEFMLSGESGMDDRWISFMRESGILDTASSTT
ncbi:fungal-specific transcription factor domain-containing protein [Phlebopus sp. FC_14]|nr:fungal-specific transcription factor domain-containing protein [Phlebopus sp. FC_14]